MRSVNEIQAAIVARLKAKTAVTSLLANVNEVREDQWQGTTFLYPNIRIDLDRMNPIEDCECAEVTGSILCFSEDGSSYQANNIANAVFMQLHNSAWTQGSTRMTFLTANVIPAIRQDERTWRSEVTFLAVAE